MHRSVLEHVASTLHNSHLRRFLTPIPANHIISLASASYSSLHSATTLHTSTSSRTQNVVLPPPPHPPGASSFSTHNVGGEKKTTEKSTVSPASPLIPSEIVITNKNDKITNVDDDADNHKIPGVGHRSTTKTTVASTSSTTTTTKQVLGHVGVSELMVVMYTCKICETRSARQISKAGYTTGSVLLRCPGCKNLHLLSDHLGWFDDDEGVDAESILKKRGEAVRRGALLPGTGVDSHVFELTADDARVLKSKTKSVRLTDGKEMEVVQMGMEEGPYGDLGKKRG